jgi:hypothetical protein
MMTGDGSWLCALHGWLAKLSLHALFIAVGGHSLRASQLAADSRTR